MSLYKDDDWCDLGPKWGMVRLDVIEALSMMAEEDSRRVRPYNSSENKRHLYHLQNGLCAGCKYRFRIHDLEVDHIIARSIGGPDHIDNLQLLCPPCNRIKGNRGMEYLLYWNEGMRHLTRYFMMLHPPQR